jgi:hypothetical protein
MNRKVLAMVRKDVQRTPDVSNAELYKQAVRLDASIRKLNLQQFHGSYRLPIARELAALRRPAHKKAGVALKHPPGPGRGTDRVPRVREPGRPADTSKRDVRGILLELAKEMVATQSRADAVGVILSLELYVDRILAALR